MKKVNQRDDQLINVINATLQKTLHLKHKR